MTKLVVIAVLVLAAVATADALRMERPQQTLTRRHQTIPLQTSARLTVDSSTRKRILRKGREYLSAEQVDREFPGPPGSVPFEIAHVAAAADGTVALAIYRFPPGAPVRAAIELWRNGELVSAFPVRPRVLGGGLGFAEDGQYVAALSPDGRLVHVFAHDGRLVGGGSATSW